MSTSIIIRNNFSSFHSCFGFDFILFALITHVYRHLPYLHAIWPVPIPLMVFYFHWNSLFLLLYSCIVRSKILANFVKEKTEQKDANNKNKTEQIKLVPNAKKGGFAPFIFQIHRFGCHVFVFYILNNANEYNIFYTGQHSI